MPKIPAGTKPAFVVLNRKNLDKPRCYLHKNDGYGIVLLEILRNTLVIKSGETRSFVFVYDFFPRGKGAERRINKPANHVAVKYFHFSLRYKRCLTLLTPPLLCWWSAHINLFLNDWISS